ncbi:MAG TPA: hypothetical protein PKW15_01300 [Alphaproteobacteria bacterium]|nr:hypothetical protein [Rhodospirillaceae bacterium]HRJ11859.1 hypothetical protein [Alphaproteobacteria bacterium]
MTTAVAPEDTVSADLPACTVAINVDNAANGARGELAQFVQDFAAAIETQAKPEHKAEVTKALHDVGQELRNIGVNTSKPKDAAVNHVDTVKKPQSSLSGTIGAVAGAVGEITGSQTARIVSQLLSSSEPKCGLAQLGKIAEKAGIKTVGKTSLENAIGNAQANVGVVKGVETLRKNGFNGDTIYATGVQLTANGGGAMGEKNFIRDTALKLNDNVQHGHNHDLSKTLARPVAQSKSQIDAANSAGKTAAPALSQNEAKASKAEDARNLRENEVTLTMAEKTPAALVPLINKRRASQMPQNAIVSQILGNKPVDPTAKTDAELLMEKTRQETEAFKKQEAEMLAANAQRIQKRPGMTAIPVLTPRMGASEMTAREFIPT